MRERPRTTLMAYALGLPAFVLIRSLLPGFYARQDTRTPVKIALVVVTVNVALKLVLMQPLSQVGLALATSAASWVNCALLATLLFRRGFLVLDARLKRRVPRQLLAALAMAAVLVGLQSPLADLLAVHDLVTRTLALGTAGVGRRGDLRRGRAGAGRRLAGRAKTIYTQAPENLTTVALDTPINLMKNKGENERLIIKTRQGDDR